MVIHTMTRSPPRPDAAWHSPDAAFDGHAVPDGVRAVRADDLERVKQVLARHDSIPVSVRPWGPLHGRCRAGPSFGWGGCVWHILRVTTVPALGPIQPCRHAQRYGSRSRQGGVAKAD